MGGGTAHVDFPSNRFKPPSPSVPSVSPSDSRGLGAVPSKLEVENAVSALEKYMLLGCSSSEAELDWLCHVGKRINNILVMMETQPSFKRLAISISSDQAVWDAIKSNEMVRKFSESHSQGNGRQLLQYSEIEAAGEDLIGRILNWILDIAGAKVTELVFKFQALVNHVFQHQDCENSAYKSAEQLEDEVRSSLILSMVILLIVVISRVQA